MGGEWLQAVQVAETWGFLGVTFVACHGGTWVSQVFPSHHLIVADLSLPEISVGEREKERICWTLDRRCGGQRKSELPGASARPSAEPSS